MKISAVEPSAKRPDRWHISVDGRYVCTLDGSLVLSERIATGRDVTAAELEEWQSVAMEQRALDAALTFLGARPRSRAEIRRRLLRPHPKREPVSLAVVERVLARLEAMGLVNDREFAEYWVEQRERFSPRAGYAITQELRQKGVAGDLAEEVAESDRDSERALAAGRPRLRALRGCDYATFRTKLGQFLLRRGFGYGVVREVTRQLWEELGGDQAEVTADDEYGDD